MTDRLTHWWRTRRDRHGPEAVTQPTSGDGTSPSVEPIDVGSAQEQTEAAAAIESPVSTPEPPLPTVSGDMVRSLLDSEHVTLATRAVLQARWSALDEPLRERGVFLTDAELRTLRAATDRLVPQHDRAQPVDLAAQIDDRLASGRADGWRFDALPPDGAAYRSGLQGLDEAGWLSHGADFADLSPERQNEILGLVQAGDAPGDTWQTMPGAHWFADLLSEAAECYYSDPLAQEEIGYAGFADLPGWSLIGLDQRDDREPVNPIGDTGNSVEAAHDRR